MTPPLFRTALTAAATVAPVVERRHHEGGEAFCLRRKTRKKLTASISAFRSSSAARDEQRGSALYCTVLYSTVLNAFVYRFLNVFFSGALLSHVILAADAPLICGLDGLPLEKRDWAGKSGIFFFFSPSLSLSSRMILTSSSSSSSLPLQLEATERPK